MNDIAIIEHLNYFLTLPSLGHAYQFFCNFISDCPLYVTAGITFAFLCGCVSFAFKFVVEVVF